MNLLVIGAYDFTQHIKVPSWKVNKEPKYKEWEDANYLTHREITRTEVSGSFTLIYDDISDLDFFFDTVDALVTASPTGAIPMTLYCNNIHNTETVNAFINFTPANEKPRMFAGGLSEFEVTVKEQ